MKFIELVRKRESTRKYLSKPVPREIIDQCLEAARLAPSACNSQPWSFLVVDDKNTIDEIVKIPIELDKIKYIIEKYIICKNNLCLHCKNEIQEDFYICPYCGQKLKERA